MTNAHMIWPDKVTICEVGLRDGLQNEKKILNIEEKLQLLDSVVESGIKIIEIGSFVHPKAILQMADTEEVARRMKRVNGVEYRALVPNLKGLEHAHASGITKAKLTVSVSKSHCINNFNLPPLEMMKGFIPCAEYADKNNMKLSGAMSSAWGCAFEGKIPIQQIEEIVQKYLELGITELSLSDATGMANPRQVFEVGKYFIKTFPQVNWILHLHDTRGMAIGNIVAGLQAGFNAFDGAFAGLGGCPYIPGASGNISTEDVVHLLHEMGIDTGVDLEKAMNTARIAEKMIGHQGHSSVLRGGRCEDLTKEKAQYQNNKQLR
ncbi:hydroxymethylglutaryl-CoA lyase [Anaerosolibacter carboniphilus]|uniref:Hydroxymethylglutaryl-CoA lyase n=1 Tax=Anaerosolibacter carboniphilus TaxID=1417629 RepID=A0A841KWT8_9FIRM|nr:hydroxymethylglutaryl-CoA lyase [Anaerosolibacter carboniphilus]MBB6218156.1 hydroxymethylglutaryl-CoA lyase [Anaerosolibacter carboniphilus]